jgi:triacylglycerol esterase/lipase EstA (alpha/beta hydrolase family)
MLARLQRFTTISLLLAAIAWAVYFARSGRPGWAIGGALLIVFGYALFLAAEFVLLALVHGDDPAPRARAGQLLRAWWGEVLTAPQVFCWRQPFRSTAEPDHLPESAAGRRGIVLVHGFVCNRGLWNPWMARLRGDGVPFVAVNLEPVFGSMDRYADTIDTAVRQVAAATGLPPVLVGHSMGGLAVRVWLQRHAGDARVHRIVTVAAPHRGTWLARFGHTANGRQMRQGNPWLARIARDDSPDRMARFTCFYGHCDNIVFPASSATLPGADNRHVAEAAHVEMLFRPQVFDEVRRWLA